MSNTIEVKKDYLYSIYSDIKDSLMRLELLLAEVGCLHLNSYEITTMDGSNLRKYLCPDCGESIEEEIHVEEI
ncbi:MAG: hypothetical protein ACW99G_17570 [Candidatus Thorarchaeota archaeon]|jgi:hypothetical protein